jgi:hypothetical protein
MAAKRLNTPSPKNIRVQKSAGNFSLRYCGRYQDGILLIYFLPKGQTINAEYHSSLLVQLKDILKEKHRAWEGHQGGLVLVQQSTIPQLTGHLQPRRKWST